MGQSPLSLLCHVLLASACMRAGSVHASQKSCANVVETRGARDAWRAGARARHAGLAVDRTERSARSTRCPRTWGCQWLRFYICTVLFPASIFTFSFLNFMCSNFYLQPFLFLLNFLSRNFVSHLSPIFQSQNLLLGLFWLPNFFLYKNFAPRLFSSKFIDVKIFQSKLLCVLIFLSSTFLFLLNFFILKFCVKTFISNFCISESFDWTFLASSFFLVQKYCTTTFLSKNF